MSIRRFMTFVSLFFLYGTALMVVACKRGQATHTMTATVKPKQDISTALVEQTTDARLGNHANPDGLVILELNEFKSGEPIILSMSVKQSPAGLQMRAVWRDEKGTILDQDRRSMNGAKLATFAYAGKKLSPGNYSVTGYWGGNVATEKKFKVTR